MTSSRHPAPTTPPAAAEQPASALLVRAGAGRVTLRKGWLQADAAACQALGLPQPALPWAEALAVLPGPAAARLQAALDDPPAASPDGALSLLVVVAERVLHLVGRREGQGLELLVLPAPAQAAPLDFLAQASHELRTPLQALLGFVAQLPAGLEPTAVLQGLRQSAELLHQRVDDLLDFSRLRLGRMPLSAAQSIDLPALFDRLASLGDSLRGRKALRIRTRLDPACPPRLRGDARRLEQVLVNLLGNAVKYTHTGTVAVRLRLRRRQGARVTLRLGVADTGVGIAFDRLHRIGRPFEQAGDDQPGSGLGLAVVQELLALFGSRLQLASVAGGGSLFWFDVELDVDEAADAPTAPEPAGVDLPPVRVLVVDDSEIVCLALQGQLQALGAVVDTAPDMATALALGRTQPFDLVLSDLRLPDGSGLDLLRQWPQPPSARALLSGHLPDAARRDAEALGLQACLAKPVRTDALQALLRACRPAQAMGIG